MMIQIGRYQLENLVRNAVPFLLLDLRTDKSIDNPQLTGRAKATNLASLLEDTKQWAADLQHPIILIGETDAMAEEAQKCLEGVGYINVYCVREGSKGLIE